MIMMILLCHVSMAAAVPTTMEPGRLEDPGNTKTDAILAYLYWMKYVSFCLFLLIPVYKLITDPQWCARVCTWGVVPVLVQNNRTTRNMTRFRCELCHNPTRVLLVENII